MNYKDFEKMAIDEVVEWYGNGVKPEDVYVVWSCKTLQNNKALLSTNVPDGMYFEVTNNGDKREIYFDAYHKERNIVIHY